MADTIRVVMAGYGRLGSELAAGLDHAPTCTVVGVCRRTATAPTITMPSGQSVPVASDLAALLSQTQPQVLLDATTAEAAVTNARTALAHGVRPVIATTGLTAETIEELDALCTERNLGGVLAPNFAIGGVLLIHLASIAARYFDTADIIELHHAQKADAPSGTALATARAMIAARGGDFARVETTKFTLANVRGGEHGGIGVHSVRLPGLVAHQEVIFGGLGQTLTLRHDSPSREAYVPGALAAIQHVMHTTGLTVGLDKVLGLA